jgi:hypothetical protein
MFDLIHSMVDQIHKMVAQFGFGCRAVQAVCVLKVQMLPSLGDSD